jgi:uncharacterized membrane protein
MIRTIRLATTLVLAAAAAGAVFAQTSAPAPATSAPLAAQATPTAHAVIQPGDRACIRQTGSLIPAKEGQCLPVAGRSYSGDEIRRTGSPDTARALQMLDPSISIGR